MNDTYIDIQHLKKYFPYKHKYFNKKKEWVRAVDDVGFSIPKGKTFGLVGESGSGKSTVGRLIMRLIEPMAGSVIFEGQDLLKLPKKEIKLISKNIQIVFQDPFGSLDPNMRIRDIIAEPFLVHQKLGKAARVERIKKLLEQVGLDAADTLNRFPHEFSGGQRQRICIARAIALNPRFVIFDEAVSALDVSVQAQILNLIHTLQKNLDLTYLFISHNLGVIHHISDIIGVMYLGKMVEIAEVDKVFKSFKHPYTEALITAIPELDQESKRKRAILHDEIPDPMNLPTGCRFHPRCPYRTEICLKEEPEMREMQPGWLIACHNPIVRKE